MTTRRSAPLALLIALLAACSTGQASPSASPSVAPPTTAATSSAAATSQPPASATPVELTVLGAASLKGALEAMKPAYETAFPGTTLTISTDSSSALETQIEQGAPADVFLSADTTNPRKLIEGGFVSGEAVTFASNELAVIVPTDNPAGVTTPADLAKSGLKVIAAGDDVPVTTYANQLVDNLAKQPNYPADFAAAYAANIASKEDNVKAVVAKIELGEGDAGIVYVTDAKASTRVATVVIPETANVVATYAAVVVNASANQGPGRDFLTWIREADGQAILASFGFLPSP